MRILFVCTGNAYRSPLAEALLKKLRPDLTVDSAGLHVAIPIAPQVKAHLRAHEALDYLKQYPESLEEKELSSYNVIVAMEPRHKFAVLRKCPDCKKKIIVWNIEDPYFESKEETQRILTEIENKIEMLAKSL